MNNVEADNMAYLSAWPEAEIVFTSPVAVVGPGEEYVMQSSGSIDSHQTIKLNCLQRLPLRSMKASVWSFYLQHISSRKGVSDHQK